MAAARRPAGGGQSCNCPFRPAAVLCPGQRKAAGQSCCCPGQGKAKAAARPPICRNRRRRLILVMLLPIPAGGQSGNSAQGKARE